MADRYRLKDGPPGVECQLVELGSFQLPLGMCWVNLVEPTGAGAARMATFVDNLELIPPPLPEEPPPWALVQVGSMFFERRDTAGIDWFDLGSRTWETWAGVCAYGTPVRLVPDPFAEPVALPWNGGNGCVGLVSVNRGRDGVEMKVAWAKNLILDPPIARLMARALWQAAADQVESGQQ